MKLINFSTPANAFSPHRRAIFQGVVGGLLLAATGAAMAQAAPGGIPQVVVPAGVSNGDLVAIIRWTFGIVIAIGALFLAGYGLLSVGGAVMKRFKDYSDGRLEMGEVASTALLGIGMLILVLVLATAAAAVIPVTV